jgi:carbamoyl-phosphate synthase large subunit
MTIPQTNVLVAGIGGASLGTEILKCLAAAGRYRIYGCDISPHAFGHYQRLAAETFVVSRTQYVESVVALCKRLKSRVVIPGGEEPMVLLGAGEAALMDAGVRLASNSGAVIQLCSDKGVLFERLKELDFPTPRTVTVSQSKLFEDVGYPCVVKAATGTGGSSFVFLAADRAEAELYLTHILANRPTAVVQEYIPHDKGGEFTVGVLSLPDGKVVGSVAMQRLFHNKLSLASKTSVGLISSGYSQGLIADFPDIREQAEKLARTLGSVGPFNVQGRVREGLLIPFEINPRFSASTYLRAMAGFNEIDIYLRFVLEGERHAAESILSGYYLRSFTEVYVPESEVHA